MRELSLLCACLPLWAACASSNEVRPDLDAAERPILAATGVAAVARPDRPAQSEAEVDAMLADGLLLDEAMTLALRRSPRLVAGFHAIGVAQAEYAQAGLLQNPVLGLALLAPDGGGRAKLALDLAQPLTSIWRLPALEAQAQARVEGAIAELSIVAHEVLVRTRNAWIEVALARRAAKLAAEDVELARRAAEATTALVAAGAGDATQAAAARTSLGVAELRLRGRQDAAADAARLLARMLILDRDLDAVAVELPEAFAPACTDEAALVEAALARRADLRAALAAVAEAETSLRVAEGKRLPEASAGLGYERPETDGAAVLGPTASIELPLFHRNEAVVAAAREELLRRTTVQAALEADVRREVRAALAREQAARSSSESATARLVPDAARTVELQERSLALGEAVLPDLLEARRALLEALVAAEEALAAAWRARLALEEAAGGPLPPR